ncbi:MAG: DUF401 family protein [bacterium]
MMMELQFQTLVPLLKVGAVFLLIVLLLRKSVQVGLALGAGALALGILFRPDAWALLRTAWTSLSNTRSLMLLAMVSLILILSSSMERSGLMDQLLSGVRDRFSSKSWAMVLLPALIGLLPMPGGAYFSAPMLDKFDPEARLSPALKSFLNYWFRHIWEYWWPLFPAVLLTCTVAELDLWRYSLASFPMTLVAAAAGIPILAKVPRALLLFAPGPSHTTTNARGFQGLLPILMALVPGVLMAPVLGLGAAGEKLKQAPRETWLLVGLVAAIIWIWRHPQEARQQLPEVLMDPKLPRMWLTIAGVLVFKGVMEASGAASEVGRSLTELQIPLGGVAVVLPLIVGLISGLPIAFVGACFPILLSMLAAAGILHLKLVWILLAFVSGFVGSLLAPTHLCLILSNEYFHAPWPKVYSYLWMPCVLLLAGSAAYFFLLRGLLE